jgi:hypothetical protein
MARRTRALGFIIDAGEPSANEGIFAGHALDKPMSRAHLDEITGCRCEEAALHHFLAQSGGISPRSKCCANGRVELRVLRGSAH